MAKRKASQAATGHPLAAMVTSGQVAPEDALRLLESTVGAALAEGDESGEGDELHYVDEDQARRDEDARRSRVNALAQRLRSLASQQVQLRQQTEERWYKDVRQFNAQYEPGTFSDGEEEQYGSKLYVPLTRRLVNLCEARLFDMLFPSDERNYTLEPTPVPELNDALQLSEQLQPGQQVPMANGQPIAASDVTGAIKTLVEQAKKANDAMQREIDDQLAECKYPTHARNAIHDAVLMGTGVLKGPVPFEKKVKRWVYNPATGTYTMRIESRMVPITVRVDPWNFFPDMSATTVDEAEFVFERHFLTKRQVSELKGMPDVDIDALRQILDSNPVLSSNNHRERLRAINGANGAPDNRYEVWEYHGPLSIDDLKDCGCDPGELDPLEQPMGIVWFCEGVVLKAALHPLDAGVLPYRVFTWQKDESNIFGYGLPYEVRDGQESANSSFRAMHDNMGLCVGPQLIADDQAVEPVNGRWEVAPRKAWRNKRPGADPANALRFVHIESRLTELQALFAQAKALVEEVGSLPAFLQGQDNPGKIQSATEVSISWTAANLWVRRCVRNWDDDVVTPMITDYYDWNMQWSEKREIKGDSKVRAMGIAALVELEGQAQRMQQFITAAKAMGVPLSNQLMMLRQFARAFKIDPDLVLPTEQEIQKMREAEAKNPPVDVEQKKVEVAQENNQLDAKTAADQITLRREEIQARREEMARREHMLYAQIASNERISVAEARIKYGFEEIKVGAEMQDRAAQRGHDAQMFNAESQLRVQTGAGV